MATALIVCPLGIALTFVFFSIFNAMASRCADEGSLGDAIDRSQLLHQELLKLRDCEVAERVSLSRTVVEGLVKNSSYMSHVLWQWRIQDDARSKQECEEVGQLRAVSLGQAWKVHSRATKLSTRLRSNRARLNWEAIAETVIQHDEMWSSYFRLLKAEYPDKFAGVKMPAEDAANSGESLSSDELPNGGTSSPQGAGLRNGFALRVAERTRV